MLVFNLGVCFVVGLNGQNTHYYAFYITVCSVQRIFLFTPSPFQRKLVRKDTTLKIADSGSSVSFQLYPHQPLIYYATAQPTVDGTGIACYGLGSDHQPSGLPLSLHSERGSPVKSGLSPLLSRVGTTALSMMTCGIMTNVCVEVGDGTDLVDDSGDGGSILDLRIIIDYNCR